ncbi:MAG TPA: hypothetical protein VGB24_13115 [Longimicrobium sp.]|jgi:hypothetical protein|uniref:hypothetical protein n=1 Tax=Longimicrobium sp. TaxID=2029185 RepID=UPI002EDAC27F
MAVRLDYHALRAMAECASSVRGKKFWLVVHELGWDMVHEEPEPGPYTVVIECENSAVSNEAKVDVALIGSGMLADAGEPDPTDVQSVLARGSAGDGTNKPRVVNLLDLYDQKPKGGEPTPADAVFWSESAVEKFLVPYYASVAGDRAEQAVGKLLNVFNRGRQKRDDVVLDDAEPFAIAHIPKSEYVTVDGEQPAATGLHVLAVSSSEGVSATPLEQFPPKKKDRERAGHGE